MFISCSLNTIINLLTLRLYIIELFFQRIVLLL
nr:MAG TPA: hypothetical protein [Caudoviricetes sp.]